MNSDKVLEKYTKIREVYNELLYWRGDLENEFEKIDINKVDDFMRKQALMLDIDNMMLRLEAIHDYEKKLYRLLYLFKESLKNM